MRIEIPDRSKFKFTTEIRVRLNETDAVGIVFHGNYFTYMDVGPTSFRFEFLFLHKKTNRLLAVGESVHVAVDLGTMRPSPVPQAFVETIAAFEGEALAREKSPDASS